MCTDRWVQVLMSEDSRELKSIHTEVISLIMIVASVAEDNLVGEGRVPMDSQLCVIFRVVTN